MAAPWQVRIPEQHYSAFTRLANLPAARFEALIAALRRATPALTSGDLSREIAAAADVNPDDAGEIIPMAVSLYAVREDMQLPISEFVGVIAEALEQIPAEALASFANNRQQLEERLRTLLHVDGALSVIAKAHTLSTEYEHTFLDARIISDVRPLFADDPEVHPQAAVIVHTLKLAYFEGYERREFFVSLSTADIRRLHAVLSRAERKAESIESLLNPTVRIFRGEDA